jgi:hypothetical protein
VTTTRKILSDNPVEAAVQQGLDPGLPPGSPDLLLTRRNDGLWQFSIRSLAAGCWLDALFGPEWTARWRGRGLPRPITAVCYPPEKLKSALAYFAAQGLVVATLQ